MNGDTILGDRRACDGIGCGSAAAGLDLHGDGECCVLQSVREEFGSREVTGFTLKASRGFSDRLEQLFVWLGGRSGLGDEAWAFGMVPRVALSVGSGDRSRSLASRVVRWWSLSSIAQAMETVAL